MMWSLALLPQLYPPLLTPQQSLWIYSLSLSADLFMHINRSEHDLSKCVVIMFYILFLDPYIPMPIWTPRHLQPPTPKILSGGHWNREGSDDHHPLLHCHSEDRGWCLCQGHRACQQCILLPQSTK